MRISVWKTILCSLLASVLLTTAVSCGNKAGPEANSVPPAASTPGQNGTFTDVRGAQWIPLSQVADTLGLRALETDSSARIGYTDVMFEVQPSQRHAVSFGKPVSLPQAPIRQNGQLYMTAASVSTLLQGKPRLTRCRGGLTSDRLTPTAALPKRTRRSANRTATASLGSPNTGTRWLPMRKVF
ncbi:hypothetical protein HMSSN036_35070 [Paenibacillus macerans]|nr:hypothetical protein HMSSN036_35070 [Paenibacillus macerans]